MEVVEQGLSARQKVERLEEILEQAPQADCPVRHYFAPGLYAREANIPAGVILASAVHKSEHLCTVSAGRIVVFMEDGPLEIVAPYTFVSKPGAKRAGVALEDTVWTTYHATTTTDLDQLAIELTESTSAQLLGGAENRQALIQRAREAL